MKDPKNFLADLEPPKYDVIERSHAERDTWQETARQFCQNADYWRARAEAAEARLVEVEALHCPRGRNIHGDEVCAECSPLRPMPCPTLRAARGEGDRGNR